jgi:uncharacterized protein YaiE (UPF0345 family)
MQPPFLKGTAMGTQFEHVAISKKANIYADGKCISYKLTFPDHSIKTIGVIMPGGVTFAADNDETVEIIEGKCRIRVGPNGAWTAGQAGHRFHVDAQASFEVEAEEPVHYVTHMGKNKLPP